MEIVNILIVFSGGIWIGAMVFFSFIVAPCLFSALGSELAGKALAKIFPFYYGVGSFCGLALLVGTGFVIFFEKKLGGKAFLNFILCFLMLGMNIYSGYILSPKIRELKSSYQTAAEGPVKEELKKRFSKLHLQSVILNLLVLLLAVAYLVLFILQGSS
jgi:uncharacterized membrane protein